MSKMYVKWIWIRRTFSKELVREFNRLDFNWNFCCKLLGLVLVQKLYRKILGRVRVRGGEILGRAVTCYTFLAHSGSAFLRIRACARVSLRAKKKNCLWRHNYRRKYWKKVTFKISDVCNLPLFHKVSRQEKINFIFFFGRVFYIGKNWV